MNLVDRSTVDQAYGHQAVEKAHRQPLREGHAPAMMTGPQGPPPPNTPSGQPSFAEHRAARRPGGTRRRREQGVATASTERNPGDGLPRTAGLPVV